MRSYRFDFDGDPDFDMDDLPMLVGLIVGGLIPMPGPLSRQIYLMPNK